MAKKPAESHILSSAVFAGSVLFGVGVVFKLIELVNNGILRDFNPYDPTLELSEAERQLRALYVAKTIAPLLKIAANSLLAVGAGLFCVGNIGKVASSARFFNLTTQEKVIQDGDNQLVAKR